MTSRAFFISILLLVVVLASKYFTPDVLGEQAHPCCRYHCRYSAAVR